MKRKIIFLIVLICMVFTSLGVSANNLDDTIIVGNKITGIFITKHPTDRPRMLLEVDYLHRASDGMFVYCIDPITILHPGLKYRGITYNPSSHLDYISEDVWERITLIAYYGYGYGNHTESKWYAVTQFLIWREVMPDLVMYFAYTLTGPPANRFASEMEQIMNLVNNHNKTPNFDDIEFSVYEGSEIIITDKNNVLSRFDINLSEYVEIIRDGNTLKIKGIKPGSVDITLVNRDRRFNMPPILYYHATSQDVMSVGRFNEIVSSFRINVKEVHREIEEPKEVKPEEQPKEVFYTLPNTSMR